MILSLTAGLRAVIMLCVNVYAFSGPKWANVIMEINMDHRLEPNCPSGPLDRLRSAPFVPMMDEFFLSKKYFMLICLLTSLANFFALELPVYGIFVGIAVYVCLFGKDLLPIVPLVICCYIVPSRDNNPGNNPESMFYGSGGTAIIVMVAILIIALLVRLALDPKMGRSAFFKTKRLLLPGILALGAAYLLAGIFSGHYFDHGTAGLVFGAVQFLAVGLLYYILAACIRWDEVPRFYFSSVAINIGFIVLNQILWLYIIANPFASGELDRNVLYTGWGNYNCMGGLLAMMIPFPFLGASVKKNGCPYMLFGTIFLGGVMLSCSRTAIIVAVVTYAASMIALFIRSENRWTCLAINAGLFAAVVAYLLIFHYDIVRSYLEIFSIKRSVISRTDGFAAGIKQFLEYPILGGGFFPVDYPLEEWSTVEAFTSFFPGLFHNTIIQIAASCGIVGLAAYGYHRYQTIRLVMKKPNDQNIFIAISLGAMLMASLFDCHFFNIGPTLFYSMAMAFAEKHDPDMS